MTIAVVHVTDRNFRVTIPDDVRRTEDIRQGDYIQIDIVKLDFKKKVKVDLVDLLESLNSKLDDLPYKIAEELKDKGEM